MDLELVESCHDCSDGGLGVSLAESSFSGGYGMEIDLSKIPESGVSRNDYLFFSESPSRFILTIKPGNKGRFETIMQGNVFAEIGKVTDEPLLKVKKLGGKTETIRLEELKNAWQKPLRFDLPQEQLR